MAELTLVCEKCPADVEGIHYCNRCDLVLCRECSRQHADRKKTSEHVLQPVGSSEFTALRQHAAGSAEHDAGFSESLSAPGGVQNVRAQQLLQARPQNGHQFEPAEAFKILIECRVRRLKLKPLIQEWVRLKRIPVGYGCIMRRLQQVHKQVCSGGKVEDVVSGEWGKY